jgi:putative DNA primase/helicase
MTLLAQKNYVDDASNDPMNVPPDISREEMLGAELFHIHRENKLARAKGIAEPFAKATITKLKKEVAVVTGKATQTTDNNTKAENAAAEEEETPEIAFARLASEWNLKQFSADEAATWTGSHWKTIEPPVMKQQIIQWLTNNYPHKSKSTQMESCYKWAVLSVPPLPEQDKHILPFANAYLCIPAKDQAANGFACQAPDPSHHMRFAVAATLNLENAENGLYQPQALPRDSEFWKFLTQTLPDADTRDLLQEYVGSTLLPDTRFQKACFFIGDGHNGKGVLMRIVKALHQKTAAMLLDRLENFNLQGLVGATLALVDEAPKAGIDEQVLKSLIAGETVQIDRKHRDILSYQPIAKWIVSANHTPKFTDHSDGFWRRWIVVPFDVQIDYKQARLDLAEHIVDNELHHVANWALAGLQRLLTRGRFPVADEMPNKVAAAMSRAKSESDAVRGWADDQAVALVADTKQWTPKNDLYRQFVQWCDGQGRGAVAQAEFYKRLDRYFQKQVQEDRPRIKGQRTYRVNVAVDPQPIPDVAF